MVISGSALLSLLVQVLSLLQLQEYLAGAPFTKRDEDRRDVDCQCNCDQVIAGNIFRIAPSLEHSKKKSSIYMDLEVEYHPGIIG